MAGQEIGVPARAAERDPPGRGLPVPPPGAKRPAPPPPQPPSGALRIIYENADFLALNKDAGLPVHGAGKSLNALVQAYLAPRLPPSLSFRPGPLHRLDRPTSGVVVFSVSLRGARYFSALLREGKIHKQYLALVEGRVEEPGLWEDHLLRDRETRTTSASAEGKPARTRFSPLYPGEAGGYSLLVLEPETGRTHQIRAQAAAHGHPLGGDLKYGGSPLPPFPAAPGPIKRPPDSPAFLLHAWKLNPESAPGNEEAVPPLPPLEAPPPDYFLAAIKTLFGRGIAGGPAGHTAAGCL
jgi:23S rRNA pseudouridine955/2504/2580 synthase